MIRALSIASVLSFAVFSLGAAWAQEHTPLPPRRRRRRSRARPMALLFT